MNSDWPVPPNDQKETKNSFSEVAILENQLWSLIHLKGLLQIEVQELYRKACSSYEKIILNDNELAELQDIEYSLWKLHYKHIDEFRKCIRSNSKSTKSEMLQTLADVHNKDDIHIEGFKSFLSEATQFYQDLIMKLRRLYGLEDESLFHGSGGVSCFVESTKIHKCQFLCHRFLICLGDLERYRELYGKSDIKNHDWSAAVTYYLNASKTWPDGGNPQNQLAVLATYIGDEFLALYHCIRSLAVKEPFPDAGDNLMLLFEKNRSSCLLSVSNDAHFDFLSPSERIVVHNNLQSVDGVPCRKAGEASECLRSDEAELWPLFIRVISFFFTQSSLEDFPCTLASTMSELEALLELEDMKLEAALESYQLMDSARTGPFKALQVVSIFIFVVHNLIAPTELKLSKGENGMQKLVFTEMALTATFICMGRIVDRCLKSNPVDSCPLLPAVLVYVEWLVCMLHKAETYGADEKCLKAEMYFFRTYIDLLNQLGDEKGEVKSPDHTALWEDYELQGFAPVAEAHLSLHFSARWDNLKSFENRKYGRISRIIDAGMKIANRSNNSRKLIHFDESKRKFCIAESKRISDRRESEVALFSSNLDVQESRRHICGATKECDKPTLEKFHSSPSVHENSVAMEEEEVILFKPITRYNSVPLDSSIAADDQWYLAGQSATPDECLRRASSVLLVQKQAKGDSFAFHSSIPNFRGNKPPKQQEPASTAHLSSETPIAAGPPSLSAWVLNRGSLRIEREKGEGDDVNYRLRPIEEIPSASLGGLSISETEDSVIGSGNFSATAQYSSPYLAPVPSAPVIPDDAVWFNDVSSSLSDFKSSGGTNETYNYLGASQTSGYSNWAGTHRPISFGSSIPGFMDGYPVSHGMTNSSEWIPHFSANLDRTNSHMQPLHYYAPTNFGNSFGYYDASRFGLFDRWGNPLAPNSMIYSERPPLGLPPPHGVDDQRREKLFQNYQRPNLYGCGAITDLKGEQQSLLQYLKERELRLQQDPQLRSPAYMGN